MKRLAKISAVIGFALVLAGAGSIAQADVIVQGNSRVDPETIRAYFNGSDPASVADGIKRLKETGIYTDVSATRQGNDVVVHVSENNIINRVAFEGNSKIKSDILLPEMQLKSRNSFDPAKASGDVERIKEIYRRAGRAAAKVSFRTVELPNGRLDVVYTIDEGDKTGVKSINFVGNTAYSSGKLVGMMQTTEMNFMSFFKTSDVYDPEKISADLELIRRFYLRNGYANFRIISTDTKFDAEQGGYILTITVNEGPQFHVSNVNVQSNLKGVSPAELEPLMHISAGDVYDGDAVEKTVEIMNKAVARMGFAFSQVRPRGSMDQAAQTVSITFVVDEGPRVYIERISIRGNTRTRDYVIRREFDIGEGDAYNRSLIDRAERRLNGLGYFKKVRVTNEPGSAPDKVIVNVDVEDQPTGNFSVSGGYSTSDGFIADIAVSESNFMGRGQYVKLGATVGQRTLGGEFSFTEPYIFDTRIAAGFDVYVKRNTVSTYNLYNTLTIGGTLRAGIPITDEITLAPRYSIFSTYMNVPNDPVHNHAFNDCWYPIPGATPGAPGSDAASMGFNCANNGEASIAIKGQIGTTVTSLFGYTLAYNTLNNPRAPTEGIYASLSEDIAGAGGDSRYFRTTGEVRAYHEIYDDIVGFIKVSGGNMFGLGDYKLRVTDQFNLGPSLVRGFAAGGIGPRDISNPAFPKGNAVGGSNFLGVTVEAQFGLPFIPRDFGLKGAVFFDAGSIWSYQGKHNFTGWQDYANYGEETINSNGGCVPAYHTPYYGPGSCLAIGGDGGKIRASVGGSILWSSPMGPIRIDLAKAISKSRYDQVQVFRIGGGTSF